MEEAAPRGARRGAAFAACLFDLDGVLADSMPQHHLAYVEVLKPHGVEVPRPEVYRREGMNAWRVAWQILEANGVQVDEAEARRLGDAKQAAFRAMGKVPLMPGLDEALALLRGAGIRVAVVTGTSRDNAAFILGDHAGRFDAVIAEGDYLEHKPHAEPYLLGARRLGAEPARCVVVENAPMGVQAAVAAGMACVGLTSTLPAAELLAAGARACAGSLPAAARLVAEGIPPAP